MKKKILIIQYFYEPLISSSSVRYERILNNKKINNFDIYILTSSHIGTENFIEKNGIFIHRVNSRFLKKKIEHIKQNKMKKDSRESLINRFIRKIMWPDFAFLWILKAYLEGKKIIKNNKIEHIHSISFPFSCHLVGLFLKLRFPKLIWNLDYIDPFSIIKYDENPSNNERMYRKLNFFVENICLKKANKIFLLKEAIEEYKKNFKSESSKMIEVPQLLAINREAYDLIEAYNYEKETLNIVYAGTLYKNIRNPQMFLELFEKVTLKKAQLRLHFIGDLKDCKGIIEEFQNRLPNKIFCYKKMNNNEVLKYLKGADILLNISNSSKYQLPGKVVEYAYFNKKIINFYQLEKDNSLRFFENYEGVLSINSKSKEKQVIDFINLDIKIKNNLEKHYPEKLFDIYFGG